ncbi:MAG: TlpA disulfide reductase family protein [Wenzhouxiangellaceae bacterium]|nr:TlpA disulfide reductase family protein [Wenzhouxiangellaceae bacterium]
MTASTRTLLLAIIIGLALGIGAAWLGRSSQPVAGSSEPGAAVGDRRPDFEHAGVYGKLWRASDFDGKPMLVNFWATWCAPCVREMPALQSLAEDHAESLNVIGIAVDEPGQVRAFIEELGVDYPILIGTSDVSSTQRAFGNSAGMLPFTVLVDAAGIIRWQHLGELSRDELERKLPAAP